MAAVHARVRAESFFLPRLQVAAIAAATSPGLVPAPTSVTVIARAEEGRGSGYMMYLWPVWLPPWKQSAHTTQVASAAQS